MAELILEHPFYNYIAHWPYNVRCSEYLNRISAYESIVALIVVES